MKGTKKTFTAAQLLVGRFDALLERSTDALAARLGVLHARTPAAASSRPSLRV